MAGAIIIAAVLTIADLSAQVASSGQPAVPGTPGTRIVSRDVNGTRVVTPGRLPRVPSVMIGTDRRTNQTAPSGLLTTNGLAFNSGVPFGGGGFGTNGAFAAGGTNTFGAQTNIGPMDGAISNRAPFLPTNIPSQLGLSDRAPFLPTNRVQLRTGSPTTAPTANPGTPAPVRPPSP